MQHTHAWLLCVLGATLGSCAADDNRDGPRTDETTGTDSATHGDSDTDPGSGTDTNSDPSCAEVDFGAERQPVDVLIVLDRSYSMEEGALWAPTIAAIDTVTAATQDTIHWGLVTFPSDKCYTNMLNQHDTCTAPLPSEVPKVALGTSDAAQAISSAMAMLKPCGSTPTAKTLEVARNYLDSVTDDLNRYVLLATDGGPNCNGALYQGVACTCTAPDNQCNHVLYNRKELCLDEQGTTAAASSLYQAGYPVFVVGMAEASATYGTVMDAIAAAGGTEKFYPVNDPTALLATLDEITGGLSSCDFNLDWGALPNNASKDPERVNFYCKDTADQPLSLAQGLKRDPGCSVGTGWDWKNEDQNTAHLCPAACEELKSGVCPFVTASFGCDTVVLK